MWFSLLKDDTGFIISAELVLVATILVLGMIVGLSEVQHAVVTEMNDVADAIGELNQCYYFSGFCKEKANGYGVSAISFGSSFSDQIDECDDNQCEIACFAPASESSKW